MTFWAWLWIGVLAVTFLMYAVLTVVVAIGGFQDVRAMFADLDRQHEGADRRPEPIRHDDGEEGR